MTRYFCDKCGKEMDIDRDMLVLNFNGFSVAIEEGLKTKTGGEMPEYQLCVDCAYDVHLFVNQKRKDGDGEFNAHETVIGKALDAGHIYR